MRDMSECATTDNVVSLIPSVPPFASAAMNSRLDSRHWDSNRAPSTRLGSARRGRVKSVDPRKIRCEFLRQNPAIRPGVQQVERKHTAIQHLVVKTTDVESGAQPSM